MVRAGTYQLAHVEDVVPSEDSGATRDGAVGALAATKCANAAAKVQQSQQRRSWLPSASPWKACTAFALMLLFIASGFISGISFKFGMRVEDRLLTSPPTPPHPKPLLPHELPSLQPQSIHFQTPPSEAHVPHKPMPPPFLQPPSLPTPQPLPHLDAQTVSPQATGDACEGAWLFILSTGRAGSTTVMDMLNLVPQISLSGEKGDKLCYPFMTLYNQQRATFSAQNKVDAFLSVASGGEWEVAAKRLDAVARRSMCTWIKGLEPRTATPASLVRVHGFKEIRECYLPLLRRAFPKAKFILNYRENVVAQSHSLWYGRLNNTKAQANINSKLESLRQHLSGADTFELPLESFNVSTFNRLLRWVGISGCTYQFVLHSNAHGSVSPWYAGSNSRAQSAIHCAPDVET